MQIESILKGKVCRKKKLEVEEAERLKQKEQEAAEEKQREEEERKAKEEKERREYEEYLKMKEAFQVEEEGYEEGNIKLLLKQLKYINYVLHRRTRRRTKPITGICGLHQKQQSSHN